MKNIFKQLRDSILIFVDKWLRNPTKSAEKQNGKGITRYRGIRIKDEDDLPKTLSKFTVYIIGIEGNEWLAKMICPCGCGDIIFLNLLGDEMPVWRWHLDGKGIITLSPSVWRTVNCKSHFILRAGQIHWCVS